MFSEKWIDWRRGGMDSEGREDCGSVKYGWSGQSGWEGYREGR